MVKKLTRKKRKQKQKTYEHKKTAEAVWRAGFQH